ncbi:hypothetical protein N7489_000235 [Penicillium chrysogenum]|uniref:uncharacterized protein n=1 Tax=Penicillium chrysogenum TaxID=5076 RepID=UPI0024DF2205|nr:uncharacterized protein N7489_000235 [Penicillium chrysogenum]KAJ5249825.1 hypothetical protein N7489_000235 [Penicillium chrysogenum]
MGGVTSFSSALAPEDLRSNLYQCAYHPGVWHRLELGMGGAASQKYESGVDECLRPLFTTLADPYENQARPGDGQPGGKAKQIRHELSLAA